MIYVPWEGSASITRRELLYAPQPLLAAINVASVAVGDLAAAIIFFTALGMTLEGEGPRACGWTARRCDSAHQSCARCRLGCR
jgi:hypothetical protein